MSAIQRLILIDLIQIDVNDFNSKTVMFLVRAPTKMHVNMCVDIVCIIV